MTGPSVFIQPKNTMPKIERIWAFVSVDPADNNEGVAAATIHGAFMPLIAADQARLDSLRPYARAIARASGMTLRLVEFSQRTVVEEIAP